MIERSPLFFKVMLTTKYLVNDVVEVPSAFPFEYYCNLLQPLRGQDVKIRSVFTQERTPSMAIYLDRKKKQKVYKFKDFSSGKQGSHIDLVKELFGLNFHEAALKIVDDYNDYILKGGTFYDEEGIVEQEKFKVDDYETRPWTVLDREQWVPFNIGSSLLEEHCVKPLDCYTMAKNDEHGQRREIHICGPYLYGYFRKDGTLYKIYQPKQKEKKFIKVAPFIQGSEQLYGHRFLTITSSLKDIMSLKSLKLSMDYIAPDSENTMIRPEVMESYLEKYERVLVLFDYDDAGIKAMLKYRELYKTPAIVLPLSKDPSDSIRDHKARRVREILVPIFDRNINNVVELL